MAETGQLQSVERTPHGLRLTGRAPAGAEGLSVNLLMDGRQVASVRPSKPPPAAAGPERGWGFIMVLAESLLEVLPADIREIDISCAFDSLEIGAGASLDQVRGRAPDWARYDERREEGYIYIPKSGGLILPLARRPAFLAKAFDAYKLADAVFERFLDTHLLLGFGTLLGCVRGNDFIGHDDDFDALYVSRAETPQALVDETMEICRRLGSLGFKARPISPGQIHLIVCNNFVVDIFAVWFSEEQFICYSIGGPGEVADFLPPRNYVFKGHEVKIPRNFEVFLEGAYGSEWRTPDPFFQWTPNKAIQSQVQAAKEAYSARIVSDKAV